MWLLLIGAAAALYLWPPRRSYALAMAGLAGLAVPAMLVAETGYVYQRVKQGDDYLTDQIAQASQDDPLLVYSLRPNARGHQEVPGSFSADFTTDEAGRRRIDRRGAGAGTVHVFGDAYTFGLGVEDHNAWLNLLADQLGDTVEILNYGVPGYSLGQMFLSFRQHAEQVAQGDLVLFTLASVDLERNLVGKAYVCGRRVQPQARQRFPRLQDGQWIEQDLGEACNFLLDGVLASSLFPVGFGKLYRSWRRWLRLDEMIAYADQVFAAADGLARERAARLQVVFVATPEECRLQALTMDPSRLATPHRSLLPYCPTDPAAAAALQFAREPHEPHWNEQGNAWAAEALRDVLASEGIAGRAVPDGRGNRL